MVVRSVYFGEMLALLFVIRKSGWRGGHIYMCVYICVHVYMIGIVRCRGFHECETLLTLVHSVHFLALSILLGNSQACCTC